MIVDTSDRIGLLRRTRNLIETLPDNEVEKVQTFTMSLVEEENPFKPVTRETVLDIRASKAEFKAGKGQDAKEAIRPLCR